METNSRKIMKLLAKEGWEVDRIEDDHHVLKHPTKPGTVVLQHPKKDLSKGTVRSIYKATYWR